MRKIRRTALVPYSASQMYELVEDVESYPQFLPWCSAATLHWRDGNELEASVEMQRAGFRRSFRTRNTLTGGKAIHMTLVEGPFNKLDGGWRFEELGKDGSKVTMNIEFEMKRGIADRVLGPFFEELCNTLVDAFIRRAVDVYGKPAGADG